MRTTHMNLAVICLTFLIGCQKAVPTPPVAVPVTSPSASGSAAVKGSVLFSGTVPAPMIIKRDADAVCLTSGVPEITTENLKVSANGGLANAVVWLKGAAPVAASGLEAASLTQKGCRYDPHVVAVRVGQTLKIMNDDQTMHNLHSLSQTNPAFNDSQPPFRKIIEKTFSSAEAPFQLKCDVHPWMNSFIFVADHPHFTITGADGTFAIQQVPAGTYELMVWHETLGEYSKPIVLTENGSVNETVTFAD